MIYDPSNVMKPAHAYDVQSQEQLGHVMSIDTETGEVVCADLPIRVNEQRDGVATHTLRFRTIYPIFGGYPLPCLFHCYGRQPA
jgi:hypothetical protein